MQHFIPKLPETSNVIWQLVKHYQAFHYHTLGFEFSKKPLYHLTHFRRFLMH